MYESPIKQYLSEMQTEMESALLCTVKQKIGYDVDKAELIKALKYDRGQYEKGYNDGYFAGIATLTCWQNAKTSPPEKEGFYFTVYDSEIMMLYYQPDNDEGEHWGLWHSRFDSGTLGYIDSDFEIFGDERVLYWMNIPEVPEEKQYEDP